MTDAPKVRFPLMGTWLMVNPPGHPRHAYDISRVGPRGRIAAASIASFVAGLARADQVYAWEQPIGSPVDGEVVTAVDGIEDRLRLRPLVDVPASMLIRPARAKGDLAQLAGNHVVIAFDGFYAVLAHIRRGTVAVSPGERVAQGQRIGLVGNSGNTLGPHLHFHVMDGTDFAKATVVPFRLGAFDRWLDGRWVPMRDELPPARKGRIRVAG